MNPVPGIAERHYVDPHSGAIIFPRGPEHQLREENLQLKALVGAILQALPAEQAAAIPAELKTLVQPAEVTDGDQ